MDPYSSDEICEALIRHLEITGSEVLEKTFVQDGDVSCAVFCMLGPNAAKFHKACLEWLDTNGFRAD